MRELAKQTQLRAGRTLLAQLVAAGEFKGALTAYSQTFEVLKPSGAPVDWVYLNPVFANIHPTGVAAKAPHPNAARLFVDFVLSKRGQELIRGMNRIPDRIDVTPRSALDRGRQARVRAERKCLKSSSATAKCFTRSLAVVDVSQRDQSENSSCIRVSCRVQDCW